MIRSIGRIILMSLIGILCMVSCTNIPYLRIKHKHAESEQELMEFVKSISKHSKGKMGNTNISIGFVSNYGYTDDKGIKRTILGSCHSVLLLFPEIDINKDTWKYMNWTDRYLLIAHELYHCECNELLHINDMTSDGCPEHYMHKNSADKWCVNKYKDKYMKQIAKGCN